MDRIERVVRKIVKNYSHSVRRCEFEDLCQTVWYLVLIAKQKYNPSIGTFEGFAYYFVNMKLKDHFGRGVNLPYTDGNFSLLQIRADLIEDTDTLFDVPQEMEEEIPEVIKMKIEGYTPLEISKIMKISYRKVRKTLNDYINTRASE